MERFRAIRVRRWELAVLKETDQYSVAAAAATMVGVRGAVACEMVMGPPGQVGRLACEAVQ